MRGLERVPAPGSGSAGPRINSGLPVRRQGRAPARKSGAFPGSGKALAALAPAAAGILLAGCDRWPLLCRDTVTAGAPSPDGARVADVVVRDCHYTTGYTTHLTLRSSKASRTGPSVAVFTGAWPLDLSWKGPRRLVVLPDARAKVLYQTPERDGVDLQYQPSGDKTSEGTR